ncbi:hypothetical protein Zmor_017026 [Zophobas morio]|uniref:Uncharacterized protein n=1 Tax=Zophobas morio TaxID=2755281 RepID=A0AA38I4N3_9CUCU|nr:hypothetical protein Zmor_017026 [Zophobas morio]
MSLFLKNLPKSFFRAVVSSRPIFNKANSLFSSIAVNAQPKLPVLAVGRSHAKSICFGSSSEEKRKNLFRKYNIINQRASSKKVKKVSKLEVISSPGVRSVVRCTIDSSENVNQETEECVEVDTKEIGKPKRVFIPKYKKVENETSRADVQAITGTWISKKCMKYDFVCSSKPKPDPATKPIKVEGPRPSRLFQACKQASSKEFVRKASQHHLPTKKVDTCMPLNEDKGATEKKPRKDNFETKAEKSAKSNKDTKGEEDKSCKPCTSKKAEKKRKQLSIKKVSAGTKKSSYKPEKRKRDKSAKKSATKDDKAAKKDHKKASLHTEEEICDKAKMEELDAKCKAIIAKLKKELENCRKAKMHDKDKKCIESPKLDTPLPKPHEQEKDVVAGSKNFLKSVCDGIFSKSSPSDPKKVTKKASKTAAKSKSAPVVKSAKTVKPVKKIKSGGCEIDLDPQYCHKPKPDPKKKAKAEEECKEEQKKAVDECKESDKKEAKKADTACKKTDEKKETKSCDSKEKKKKAKKTSSKECKKEEKAKKSSSDVCKQKEDKKEAKQKPKKESGPECHGMGGENFYEKICEKFEKKKRTKKVERPKSPCSYNAPSAVKKKEKKESDDTCEGRDKKSSDDHCENEKKEAKKSSSDKCEEETDDKKEGEIKKSCICIEPSKQKSKKAKTKPKKKLSESDVICSKENTKSGKEKKKHKVKADCSKEKKKSESKEQCDEEKKSDECTEKAAETKCDEKDHKDSVSDQSPLMQCITQCKKMIKTDDSQSSKAPTKDQKECPKTHRIHKKIAEIDKQTKDKVFVPCQHEDIKPEQETQKER